MQYYLVTFLCTCPSLNSFSLILVTTITYAIPNESQTVFCLYWICNTVYSRVGFSFFVTKVLVANYKNKSSQKSNVYRKPKVLFIISSLLVLYCDLLVIFSRCSKIQLSLPFSLVSVRHLKRKQKAVDSQLLW